MVKEAGGLLVSLYERARKWMGEPIKRGQSLPPYILIALLWWLSGQSDDFARREDAKNDAINAALIQYQSDRDEFQNQKEARNTCISAVEGRNNQITNWKDLFAFLSLQSPEAAEFSKELEQDFDSKPRNQPTTVEIACADIAEPEPVVIPPILVEEGIISNEN